MIPGWCMGGPSSPTRAGIRCLEFFGAASDSRSASDLELDTSEDLVGAGVIGDTTGVTVEHSSTIANSSPTAGSLVMTGSITVISTTVTLTTAISAITIL